jgi:hypothetical protein
MQQNGDLYVPHRRADVNNRLSSATLGSIEQDVSQSSTTCWKGLNHFNDV